jgi:hypothetical protein
VFATSEVATPPVRREARRNIHNSPCIVQANADEFDDLNDSEGSSFTSATKAAW